MEADRYAGASGGIEAGTSSSQGDLEHMSDSDR